MPRDKKPAGIHIFTGKKVNTIITREELTAAEFCRRVKNKAGTDHVPSTYMNGIINGHIKLSPGIAKRITEAFPKYRLNWLLGYDSYPTEEERAAAQIEKLVKKTDMGAEELRRVCAAVADMMALIGLYWDGEPQTPDYEEIDDCTLRRKPFPTVTTFAGVSFQAPELVAIASKLYMILGHEIDFAVEMKKQAAFDREVQEGKHDFKITPSSDLAD